MRQEQHELIDSSTWIRRKGRTLRDARSEYRVLLLVAVGLLAATALPNCTWGWADNNCNDSNCVGACVNGTRPVITRYYCQQQGELCCQCEEDAYDCVSSGPCLTSFWYDRTKYQSAGDCETGQGGVLCNF